MYFGVFKNVISREKMVVSLITIAKEMICDKAPSCLNDEQIRNGLTRVSYYAWNKLKMDLESNILC